MSALKSVLDYKSIREGYDKLGGNPFGIKPDPPAPTEWFCEASSCERYRDLLGEYHGDCRGYCYG